MPLCEALDIGLQPSSSPQTLESTSHTMGVAQANISNLYNSFHWTSPNWKRHAYIAVVLVKNTIFLFYLRTEPTNIWKDMEMLDWVHIWSKTHIHSLLHLTHTQQLSQTHFRTWLTRCLLGHKINRCTCQFRFCKGNRDVWFRCLRCLWNCGTITWEGH